ncbi:MAG: cellulase family glycosylhydrolase, partial [Fibrobacteraceae bacterium]
FFAKVAQRYAGIPNIIWEVYNEPVNTSWSTIQSYANTVIGSIRNYSDNLALVGTSNWSQNPQEANSSPVNAKNVAYVLHFYAGSHSVGSYGSNITSAMGAGHAVFISEWGTTDANGSGSVSSSETANWISFMESNKISNCNWSLRQASSTLNNTTEASALFTGSTNLTTQEALSNATYSTSGSLVKNYLTTYSKSAVWQDTLTSGARSGACAFAHQSVPETQGTITGVANSSCTYTSSNESVATISGGVITVSKAGYAVMTGNDGTKSVVTATPMPVQTFNFPSYTCRIDTSCSGMNAGNYSGLSSFEKTVDRTTTDQGATITYSSDNPDIISVEQVTCTGTSCLASQKNNKIWIARFNSRGTATIRAKAPAVTGYQALDTAVNFYYLKKQQRYNSAYFRDTAVSLNSSTRMLLDTARYEQAAITYAFSPEGFATKNGEYLVAGANDATITVTATIAETTNYEGQTMKASVVIGTGIQAFIEKRPALVVPFLATVNSQDLVLTLKQSAFVSIQVINAAGKKMDISTQRYFPAGEQRISLASLAQGRYFVRVQQGGVSKTFTWSKQ